MKEGNCDFAVGVLLGGGCATTLVAYLAELNQTYSLAGGALSIIGFVAAMVTR